MVSISMQHLIVVTTAWLLSSSSFTCWGFVIPKNHYHSSFTASSSSSPSTSSVLQAKKKNRSKDAPKGFGQSPSAPEKSKATATSSSTSQQSSSVGTDTDGGSSPFLTSVPTTTKTEIDESVPVEERTKQILRETYGLRTMKEQQEEQAKQEARNAQRKKLEEWKQKADNGEEFDIMKALPGDVIVAIDTFLKLGLGVCSILFVLAGMGITVEAWSKTTNSPLPENIDTFIVSIIEPNFTTGLLVLLGFSISLGVFATAQLSSASSTYREDK